MLASKAFSLIMSTNISNRSKFSEKTNANLVQIQLGQLLWIKLEKAVDLPDDVDGVVDDVAVEGIAVDALLSQLIFKKHTAVLQKV